MSPPSENKAANPWTGEPSSWWSTMTRSPHGLRKVLALVT
jgi:hypothetical protein